MTLISDWLTNNNWINDIKDSEQKKVNVDKCSSFKIFFSYLSNYNNKVW